MSTEQLAGMGVFTPRALDGLRERALQHRAQVEAQTEARAHVLAARARLLPPVHHLLGLCDKDGSPLRATPAFEMGAALHRKVAGKVVPVRVKALNPLTIG